MGSFYLGSYLTASTYMYTKVKGFLSPFTIHKCNGPRLYYFNDSALQPFPKRCTNLITMHLFPISLPTPTLYLSSFYEMDTGKID